MLAKLFIQDGQSKGLHFKVGKGRSVIGRGDDCEVRLRDTQVSRQHCAIEYRDERYVLLDMGSKNGVLLNGRRVKEEPLSWGDKIKVGETNLVFIVEKEDADTARKATDTVMASPTISLLLSPEELKRGDETWLRELKGAENRATRNLTALYEIAKLGGTSENLNGLLRQALAVLFRATVAASGSIRAGLEGEPPVAVAAARDQGGDETVVPTAVGERVVRDGTAMMIERETKNGSLAAPLKAQDKTIGLVYLVAPAGAGFEEADLHLLSAVGNLLGPVARNLLSIEHLNRRNRDLVTSFRDQHRMVGESPAHKKVLELISRVAPSDASVLICGESGTGKELAARALHLAGPRADAPFVAINCGAIPRDLVESELFGHEKGAFTGATRDKKGRFELASSGTLFLDEVGELDPASQVKLLRVLEERRIGRVGGIEEIPVDVRILAATNRDLKELVDEGAFREDLYYRLQVITLTLPPLRERPGDIAILAQHYLDRFRAETGKKVGGFAPAAQAALEAHPWPGNIRELRNCIERAVLLCDHEAISAEDLFLPVAKASRKESGTSLASLEQVEREHLLYVLKAVGDNRTKAAQVLGIDRKTLYLKLKDYGLE